MLGAKNIAADERTLTFKIGKNAKGVTHVRVTLDPSDTYTLTFLRVRGTVSKVVSEVEGVYFDGLHRVIEQGTELYTSL